MFLPRKAAHKAALLFFYPYRQRFAAAAIDAYLLIAELTGKPHFPMQQRSRKPYFVASLSLLFLVLFTFPILGIFNRPVLVWGLPLLYLWVFAAWMCFVLLAGWMQYRLRHHADDEPERNRP